MKNTKMWAEKAQLTLKQNDLGGYTVPTRGLYPFQWNWDSAITALGWLKCDEPRAWQEIELLLSGQWENGMVPHVLFHAPSDTYFPGPDIWGSHRDVKSTSISQPPVLATVARLLYEQCIDRKTADEAILQFLPKIVDYHLWWYRERDPENTGLVVSYHPWESGMDNSPAWDQSLAAVPCVTWPYQRRDLSHVDASERPHKAQYDRYLYLVELFKNSEFDSEKIFQDVPYKVNDIGIISILHRATKDLLFICERVGMNNASTIALEQKLELTKNAISQLWCETDKVFYNRDVLTDNFCRVKTNASLLPLYSGLVNEEQYVAVVQDAESWMKASSYCISSTHPHSEFYEPQRYWRGPIWLHINWMIAIGFEDYGHHEFSEKLKSSAQALIEKSGYFEYFHADSGDGCGGDDFSWTAAIALYWLL